MISKKIWEAISVGMISGIFLGLFLKIIEYVTNLKVYTLLLNVDYVPLLNMVPLHESIEFSLHLIISIFVSLCFILFLGLKKWQPRSKFLFVVIVSILIGLLLFPTTILSTRTPSLSSFPALGYWLLGHGLYGLLLAFLLGKKRTS